MHVILDFTVIPIGSGTSLSSYIAVCQRILEKSGLTYEMHANGTNLEGEWDTVFNVIRHCHETLHNMGVARIHTDIKLGTRSDRFQTMKNKTSSVAEKISADKQASTN